MFYPIYYNSSIVCSIYSTKRHRIHQLTTKIFPNSRTLSTGQDFLGSTRRAQHILPVGVRRNLWPHGVPSWIRSWKLGSEDLFCSCSHVHISFVPMHFLASKSALWDDPSVHCLQAQTFLINWWTRKPGRFQKNTSQEDSGGVVNWTTMFTYYKP